MTRQKFSIFDISIQAKSPFFSSASDLVTMFRTYFFDNLDHCDLLCHKHWPKNGTDFSKINKVNDGIFNIMQACQDNEISLNQKDYEFLKQLDKKLSYSVPMENEILKKEALGIVELVYYRSSIDMKEADRIYKKMAMFDKTNQYRKNLVDWMIAGLNEDYYQHLRKDILSIGIEIMHIFLRKNEFGDENTCDDFIKHLDFLIDVSSLWVWQARGLIFSDIRKPTERQDILIEGLASTLIELAWYLEDTDRLPQLFQKSCNMNFSGHDYN